MTNKIVDIDHLSLFKQQLEESISSSTDSFSDRLIDNASYNILPNKAQNTEEADSGNDGGSIDWQINDDGTVLLKKNTYPSSVTKYLVLNNSFTLYPGKYTLYGCAMGGGDSTYWIELDVGNQAYKDKGHGVVITVSEETVSQIKIAVKGEAKNIQFYPMLLRGQHSLINYTEPSWGDPGPDYLKIDGVNAYAGKVVWIYLDDPEDVTKWIIRDIDDVDNFPTNTKFAEENDYINYYPTNVELAEMVNELSERDINVATTLAAGIVKPDGTTITVDQDGTIHGATQVDTATSSSLGVVKPDNDTITIDANGVISAVETPVATTSAVGTVKPDGTTITIDNDGTIHGASQVDIATASTVGVVKPDGSTTSVNTSGALSVNTATSSAKGIVKPDNDSITVDANGEISCNLTSYTTSELDTMWANAGNNS